MRLALIPRACFPVVAFTLALLLPARGAWATTVTVTAEMRFERFTVAVLADSLGRSDGEGVGVGTDALRQLLTALSLGAAGATKAELDRVVGPPVDFRSRARSAAADLGIAMLIRGRPLSSVVVALQHKLGVGVLAPGPLGIVMERHMSDRTRCALPPVRAQELVDLLVVACSSARASWRIPFGLSATARGTFHGIRHDVAVEFLHSTRLLKTVTIDRCRVIRLALTDAQDATLVLPQTSGIDALRACVERIPRMLSAAYRERSVDLEIPKGTFEFSEFLNEPFQALGLRDAVDLKRVDFSPLLGGHPAFADGQYSATARLSLDERGVTANSRVIARFSELLVSPERPIVFHADRPFIFCLSDDATQELRFAAVITQP